jgi:hypothetical protein
MAEVGGGVVVDIDMLSDREVIDLLQSDTLIAKVRRLFSQGYAEIEQATQQRNPPSPVELRRMELKIADNIYKLFAVRV